MNGQNRRKIDQVLDPGFVGDLGALGLGELRRRHGVCSDLDVELSFYRRMLHGRLDLLSFEMRRRRGEESRTLMEALPEILAGDTEPLPPRPVGESRALSLEAPDLPPVGRREADRALSDDFLARISGLSDAELEETGFRLAAAEEAISRQRRLVFDALDAIQSELAARYRRGAADPAESIEG